MHGNTAGGIDWATAELPDAWPDRIPNRFQRLAMVFRSMAGKRVRRVQLPDALPLRRALPKYLLQEFHHLPNGNYSKTITRGYARSFDKAMLGSLAVARAEIARRLAGGTCVLDVGCGGGQLTGALLAAGLPQVWALEPSP